MALINCPECGKEISDSAIACPNCGYSIKETNTDMQKESLSSQNNNPKTKKSIKIACIILIVAIAFGGLYTFLFKSYTDPINGEWTFSASLTGNSSLVTLDDMKEKGITPPTLTVSGSNVTFKLLDSTIETKWTKKVEKDGDYFYMCDPASITLIMSQNDSDTCSLIMNGTDDNIFMFEKNK